MKKIILTLLVFVSPLLTLTNAQLKIGYVDSDSIMDKFADAQDARQKLDVFIQDWQNELKKIENSWKAKYDDYEKRKLIMSDQTRAEMESELINLEKQIADYRDKKFGTNGELFQKQDEIMKPVQNKVFTAIKDVAKDEDLDFIFDRSGDVMLLFAKDEYDVTALVLEKLKLK
jgi:outer membrane protein